MMNIRRETGNYFSREEGTPEPICVNLCRRVQFSEADAMGIVWFGHYLRYFEEAAAELGRQSGLSYKDLFETGLRTPVAQVHVDYHLPLRIDEQFVIKAVMIWSEGARLNTEYSLIKEDGSLAATGYSVQLFIDAGNGDVCLVVPPILGEFRKKWKDGKFKVFPLLERGTEGDLENVVKISPTPLYKRGKKMPSRRIKF
ncbi:MAG: acyl-CoA thioesterase [Elusimicrobiota bacterium]